MLARQGLLKRVDAPVVDAVESIGAVQAQYRPAMPVEKAHVTGLMKKASGKWWVVAARAFEYVKMPPMAKK